MAQKNGNDKPIEITLWDAANKLRGSVEPVKLLEYYKAIDADGALFYWNEYDKQE